VRERESRPAATERARSSSRLPLAKRDDRREVAAREAAGLPRPSGPERGAASVPSELVRPRDAGSPLAPATRAQMEAALGTDLAAARVHTGSGADRAARAIGASAYTVGPSIVFADGAYAPDTRPGAALLLHELAHSVQDPRGTTVHRYDNVCEPDDPDVIACEAVPEVAPVPVGPVAPPDPRTAALEAAQALDDDRLRARMTETQLDLGRRDASALGDHELFRYELARRGLEEPMPSPGMQTITSSDGLLWSLSPEYSRWQVERVMAGAYSVDDYDAEQNLIRTVRGIMEANGYSPVAGTPEPGSITDEQIQAVRVALDIQELAQRHFADVRAEVETFMASFEPNTLAFAYAILAASERRIREELVHYGITLREDLDPFGDQDIDADIDEGGAYLGEPVGSASDDPAAVEAREGLAHAAGELAVAETRRRAVEHRYHAVSGDVAHIEECSDPSSYIFDEDLDARVDEVIPPTPEEYCRGTQELLPQIDQLRDARDALRRLLDEENRTFEDLRTRRENEFPILASYTSNPRGVDIAGLTTLSRGADAAAIAQDAITKLENIARVRSKLASGDLTIWELPDLIRLAQQRDLVAPASPYAFAIGVALEDAASDGTWRTIGITVLSIGLGLIAAIPTGGASLTVTVAVIGAEIAGFALDLYLLSESLDDYATQRALTNTDYDRARSLSREEPSLFWLAIDIIGAAIGGAGAVRGVTQGFRSIARARRLALAARNVDEVVEQLAQMHRVRAELGLAADVSERLELQLLSELPDRHLAESVAGSTIAARNADEIATRIGRRLTDAATPDDLAPLSRELGLPVDLDTSLTRDVRVMTELVDGRVVRARRIVVGANATIGDILAHRETIALLGELERVTAGLAARTDELLGTVVGPTGDLNPFPAGSQAFNSWVELRKYPQLIQSRHARLAEDGITAAERVQLREDIRFFETELAYHREIIDARVLERGESFIASSATRNAEAAAQNLPFEFHLPATADAPARTFTIGQPGSPYYYARAGDGTDRLVIRRYVDAVDAPAVTVTRAADGGWVIAEGGLSRADAGRALVRSWPQNVQDAFTASRTTLEAQADVFRVVPLAGLGRLDQTIGSLMSTDEINDLTNILTASLARNGRRSPTDAATLAERAVEDLTGHSIVVVRGTDQLRAYGYRARFISRTGTEVDGDLHHLIPLYLGGNHRIGNLLDLDVEAHRAVHELLEGVNVRGGLTLAPNSVGRIDLDFEAGMGILYRDGRIELRPIPMSIPAGPSASMSSSAAP
jgi:hypothetical protein